IEVPEYIKIILFPKQTPKTTMIAMNHAASDPEHLRRVLPLRIRKTKTEVVRASDPSRGCLMSAMFVGFLIIRLAKLKNAFHGENFESETEEVSRDESLIFELLDLKHEVEDGESAVWFLHDLATEQDAEEKEEDADAILAGSVKLLLILCSIFQGLLEWLSKLK
ncbi:hypothetical protein ACLOJK_000206, partial [Asimina triloba]